MKQYCDDPFLDNLLHKTQGLKKGVNSLFLNLLIDERAAKLSLAALSYPPLTLNS